MVADRPGGTSKAFSKAEFLAGVNRRTSYIHVLAIRGHFSSCILNNGAPIESLPSCLEVQHAPLLETFLLRTRTFRSGSVHQRLRTRIPPPDPTLADAQDTVNPTMAGLRMHVLLLTVDQSDRAP